jgi:hypothetical protein
VTEKGWSAELHVSPVWRAAVDVEVVRKSSSRRSRGSGSYTSNPTSKVSSRVGVGVRSLGRVQASPGPCPRISGKKESEGEFRHNSDHVELNCTWHLCITVSLSFAISMFAGTDRYCVNGSVKTTPRAIPDFHQPDMPSLSWQIATRLEMVWKWVVQLLSLPSCGWIPIVLA